MEALYASLSYDNKICVLYCQVSFSVIECTCRKGRWVRVANGTSGSFCLDCRPQWVRLVICDMVVPGRVGTGREACPTLSYSMEKGAVRMLATSSSGRERIYFVKVGVTSWAESRSETPSRSQVKLRMRSGFPSSIHKASMGPKKVRNWSGVQVGRNTLSTRGS